MDKAFWFYRAIFLRQCHFQNVLLFPRKQAWSSVNISSDGVPLSWQKHNCPHFERKTAWMKPNRGIHYATLWHNHCDSATKLRLLKVRAIMLLSTQLIQWDAVKKILLLQACLRGKSSTFWKWHCLRKIALESKRLQSILDELGVKLLWKRIFYPIQ